MQLIVAVFAQPFMQLIVAFISQTLMLLIVGSVTQPLTQLNIVSSYTAIDTIDCWLLLHSR